MKILAEAGFTHAELHEIRVINRTPQALSPALPPRDPRDVSDRLRPDPSAVRRR